MKEDLEGALQELKTRSRELEDSKNREEQYKTRMEEALSELQKTRESQAELKREVEERSAKDPVQVEEIKVGTLLHRHEMCLTLDVVVAEFAVAAE
jgi:chromosome segregation ATPase